MRNTDTNRHNLVLENVQFKIFELSFSLHSHRFRIEIDTSNSKEEVYELLRERYVPIAVENIENRDGGFILNYPELPSHLAGDFYNFVFIGQMTNQADPVAYSLEQMKIASPNVATGGLDPTFYAGLVRKYYEKVDAGEIDWIIGLFSEDGVYERANTRFDGKDAIAAFYREDRKILGRHIIDDPIVRGDVVIVRGRFQGRGEDGSPKDVRFADVWKFDERLVAKRETYLAIGSDYVKD